MAPSKEGVSACQESGEDLVTPEYFSRGGGHAVVTRTPELGTKLCAHFHPDTLQMLTHQRTDTLLPIFIQI